MEDNYTLWVLRIADNKWYEIWSNVDYDACVKWLKLSTVVSVNYKLKGFLFKIAKVGDTAWMKYLPDNIMKGGK